MPNGKRLAFTLATGLALVATLAAVASAMVDAPTMDSPQADSAPCRAGTKRAIIGGKVKCLRAGQSCTARYQAAYKKYGFTCVSGHLRKRSTAPPPQPPPSPPPVPPAPPPAPPAQPGHYRGATTQLEVFEFDVNASGTQVQNLSTGQINEGCTPPAHLSGGNIQGGSAPITSNGDFTIDVDYKGTVGDSPSTGRFTITGHFSGATATGTLQDSTSFTFEGVAYSCGSGLQNWTATRSG